MPNLNLLNSANKVHWKSHDKFLLGQSFDQLLIAKKLPVWVNMVKPHPMLLIMLTRVLFDHTSYFGINYPSIGFN